MNADTFQKMLLRIRAERSRDEHVQDLKLIRARWLVSEKQRLLKRLEAIDSELRFMGSGAEN